MRLSAKNETFSETTQAIVKYTGRGAKDRKPWRLQKARRSACGALTAVDAGIAPPDARGGDDEVAAKVRHGSPYEDFLDMQNITYNTLVLSSYRRPHPSTFSYLRNLARRLARRRGCTVGEWRLQHMSARAFRVHALGGGGPDGARLLAGEESGAEGDVGRGVVPDDGEPGPGRRLDGSLIGRVACGRT